MLVVGAGPVGLGMALLLARWRVPTVVLEARPGRDTVGSKAICVQRDVLDIFERVGCGRAMAEAGVTWTVGRTYYRDRELFSTTFPDPGAGPPPWINIPQRETERYLAERAGASELVDVRYAHRVTGLDQDGTGVRVRVDTSDGPVTLAGSHLVAADGARGTIREFLGIDFPGHSFGEKFLICDIRAELPFPNERRFYFDPAWNPGRQVLVHQCPDSTWRIDWQVPGDYHLDGERESGALDARIRRITGDVPYQIVWLSVYRFHQRCATAFRSGRVFLAGDCAHLFAPFGARGMNSGMQDAENLAWKLAFVRTGRVSGPAAEVLLDSYHGERHPAALENLRVTNATMEFLAPHTPGQHARRRTTLDRAVTDLEARAQVDSGRLAEPYWYTDSTLTTPSQGGEVFPVGPGAPRPPVAGVLCPDAPCVVSGRPDVHRLRQLFGTTFVLLLGGPGRLAAARDACAGAGGAVEAYQIGDIDHTGAVAAALRRGADSVHLVRPDGHLAAVSDRFDPAALKAALRRATGWS